MTTLTGMHSTLEIPEPRVVVESIGNLSYRYEFENNTQLRYFVTDWVDWNENDLPTFAEDKTKKIVMACLGHDTAYAVENEDGTVTITYGDNRTLVI